MRSQTLYVKRRTAFLNYTEDPRGSRSLFVRFRSSAGEAATLDYPQLSDTKTHPAGDGNSSPPSPMTLSSCPLQNTSVAVMEKLTRNNSCIPTVMQSCLIPSFKANRKRYNRI
ncbi:hypothetical protein F5879DRAFT_715821 [Lentinula edodes]|nr:hypothetical protein F5879DRAFT_715821 [Lentinula edodes]